MNTCERRTRCRWWLVLPCVEENYEHSYQLCPQEECSSQPIRYTEKMAQEERQGWTTVLCWKTCRKTYNWAWSCWEEERKPPMQRENEHSLMKIVDWRSSQLPMLMWICFHGAIGSQLPVWPTTFWWWAWQLSYNWVPARPLEDWKNNYILMKFCRRSLAFYRGLVGSDSAEVIVQCIWRSGDAWILFPLLKRA